ncbi:DMT family transporter [Photobacterium sanguinicancri]|uniref:QacE family quaternary ammonium compound efflux SMR transporter n=1 Tax=Photobacterium sanguinicancri TaxID=875932 RepID=A0ABX4FS77_9GAMM|nr:multidrug efflux SMR transporter [Photobacterium sanguinicancri]OZS41672.1 QacE family quaternary ammonium compound efflux SMR transporter [Photobacterium sanguinicancri]
MLSFLTSLSPMIPLSIAIVCEVIATSFLPKTEQFTKPGLTLLVLAGYGIAFFMLSLTVRTMPVGVAYAIWCGAGIVLVAMLSWVFSGQHLDKYAVLGIGLIMAGTIIINVFSKSVTH